MFKHIISGGLALATLVAGSLAGANVASAERADFRDSFHDQFAGRQDFLSELCGFEIWFEVDAKGHARFWDDGRIQAQDHGTTTFVNPENGKTLTRFWAGQFQGQGEESFDDGILTITFEDTYYGVHEKWLGPDGGVLVMDRGRATIVGEVVIDLGDPEDPEDDQLVHFHESYEFNGPHPILEGDPLDPAAACEILA